MLYVFLFYLERCALFVVFVCVVSFFVVYFCFLCFMSLFSRWRVVNSVSHIMQCTVKHKQKHKQQNIKHIRDRKYAKQQQCKKHAGHTNKISTEVIGNIETCKLCCFTNPFIPPPQQRNVTNTCNNSKHTIDTSHINTSNRQTTDKSHNRYKEYDMKHAKLTNNATVDAVLLFVCYHCLVGFVFF